ncbi:MAG: diphthamide biosynthesis enzyme Dph2 [Candidatus Micrarchaeota archaeon]
MRILIQFPEGLKQKAMDIKKRYESEGHEVFLSASACYGACDLALDEARWIEADKIVHFGHNRFLKAEIAVPVEYIEYSIDIDIDALRGVLGHLEGYWRIGLATTVQHIHQLEGMKAFFERNGKTVLIGKGCIAERPGQILGCDGGAVKSVEKEADAIVFVGSGLFHALAIDVQKPALVFNPLDSSVKDIRKEAERLRKKRNGAIAKALTSKSFGILLSTKPGQFSLSNAKWAKRELEKRGFECAILVANELEPMTVKNFMAFDCLVNTACPRMSDDSEEYGRALLDISMLKRALDLMDSS